MAPAPYLNGTSTVLGTSATPALQSSQPNAGGATYVRSHAVQYATIACLVALAAI